VNKCFEDHGRINALKITAEKCFEICSLLLSKERSGMHPDIAGFGMVAYCPLVCPVKERMMYEMMHYPALLFSRFRGDCGTSISSPVLGALASSAAISPSTSSCSAESCSTCAGVSSSPGTP